MSNTLGFMHFINQSDMVSKTLLIILLIMSLISWSVFLVKLMNNFINARKGKRFLRHFRMTKSTAELKEMIEKFSISDESLMAKQGIESLAFYHEHSDNYLVKNSAIHDFLTITLRNSLDEIQLKKENGLSALATIAATAPFVGLFGTVWGIYHALITISAEGAGTIDKVAGPVGEALIMTGIGLFVAIPAVISYNLLSRKNRVFMGKLDSFAFELLTVLTSQNKHKTNE